MRKKRVLFVTEATYLNTGYSTYGKNIIQKLVDSGKYEVAEFSIYGTENNKRRSLIPWKTYPNVPSEDKVSELAEYNARTLNHFGAWRFERVCLDFKPDVVLSIRDFWMDSFIYGSPFRRLFSWVWMPTVDADPQNEEWIHYYSDCDGIITYSKYAEEILRKQSGGKIKLFGVASPSASEHFKIMDRPTVRKELGLPEDANIIGTVMRNQRRKLFPLLFSSFGEYLRRSGDLNTFLYCHTSYPDSGWNIAKLLHQNGISSRVFFSYCCSKCGYFEARKFRDAVKFCPNCQSFTSTPVGVNNGLDDESLAKVYNSFDGYIQCANSEGFGIPQIEAAACGIPIATVDYSAMSDVIEYIGAIAIEPRAFYEELETGCRRAVPDQLSIINAIEKLKSQKIERSIIRAKFDEHYSVEKSADVWGKAIDAMPLSDWTVEARLLPEELIKIEGISHSQFIDTCCDNYLIDKRRKYGYDMRRIRQDLNCGMHRSSSDGYLTSEISYSEKGPMKEFTRDLINQWFVEKAKNSNFWERARVGIISLGEESWLN